MELIRGALALLFLVNSAWSVFYYQPEQVHLAYGENTSQVVVTWSTVDDTGNSVVEYGIGGLILSAVGERVLFTDGGKEKRSQYIHKVVLSNLQPDSKYTYHCGSDSGWSPEFWFKTPPEDANWQPHFAVYGDMGNENAQSLGRLQEETQRSLYDAILHVGDFAYDMDSDNARIGDEFMRQIESIAAYLPYMTCPGNHENTYNFSNYKARFNMPSGNDSFAYSINIGPIHLISISTEVWYFLNYGLKPLVFQYQWLEEDLAKANLPENREKQPWIVVMGHRPMYCSDLDNDDCTHHETITRVGLPFMHFFGLEDLLYNYGVDVEIWAHEHTYERLWPVYDYVIYNGSYSAPYTNPGAPVQIITGSAGCKEGRDDFNVTRPEWSAFASQDYGYTRMKVYNRTHLYLEQVSDDKAGQVIDSIWVIKDHHGAYQHSKMDWDLIDTLRLRSFDNTS